MYPVGLHANLKVLLFSIATPGLSVSILVGACSNARLALLRRAFYQKKYIYVKVGKNGMFSHVKTACFRTKSKKQIIVAVRQCPAESEELEESKFVPLTYDSIAFLALPLQRGFDKITLLCFEQSLNQIETIIVFPLRFSVFDPITSSLGYLRKVESSMA